jgi:hypothetical protein
VVFVADATPSALAANVESWRRLDEAMRACLSRRAGPGPWSSREQAGRGRGRVGGRGHAHPVEAVLSRAALSVQATCRDERHRSRRAFREAVMAGIERALGTSLGNHRAEATRFLSELARTLGGTATVGTLAGGTAAGRTPAGARPPTAIVPPPRRVVKVEASANGPDGAAVTAALSTQALLAVRDHEVREMSQQRALGRLLVDLGHLCLGGSIEPMVRAVISSLVMNLDASGLGGAAGAGCRMPRPRQPGPLRGGDAISAALRPPRVVRGGQVGRVPPEVVLRLPARGTTRRASSCRSRPAAPPRGGILLLAPGPGPPRRPLDPRHDRGLPRLASSRLSAISSCGPPRTSSVAWRSAPASSARRRSGSRIASASARASSTRARATVDAERRLFDRERTEGVRRLAAGLAHEVNNPLAAIQANLQFLEESVGRLRTSAARRRSRRRTSPGGRRRPDGREARVGERARAVRRCGRLAAVGAPDPLGAVVRDTVAAFRRAMRRPCTRLDEGEVVLVGLRPPSARGGCSAC